MADLKEVFDVVVVGSGATGGWAAKELTEAGLRVALVEAGPNLDAEKEFTEHLMPYELRHRGFSPELKRTRPIQSRCYACMEYNYQWFVNDLENPYITPPDKPFNWYRVRKLGGRSLVWYRLSYRMGDVDFKTADRDGYGENWPLSYAELEPYYDKVEQFIGVSGRADGLPQLPDGKFLPPMPMTCGEVLLRKTAKEKFGRAVTIGRQAVLTVPHNGRAPCNYCGPCERGCATQSYFSSPTVTIPAAQATGRLTLLTDAVVSHVTTDLNTSRATGVRFVHRVTREVRELRAHVVVLCAQALESTRILLNSANRQFPNGLANSSGALGHYLMDHVTGFGASGALPGVESRPWAGPPRRPNVIYVPRFRNISDRHPDFIRGYGLQGRSFPQSKFWADGLGKDFKEEVKRGQWRISLKGYGDSLPRWDNYCELDPNVRDAWGIPALRINASHGENELKMGKDMVVTAAEMIEAAGAKDIQLHTQPDTFGEAIHEVGTARMGNDPKKSVLNKYCQAHDVRNLFVMDGSGWVTSACQNPTLTMMAVVCHACDSLIRQARKGEL